MEDDAQQLLAERRSPPSTLKFFSLSDLESATNNFDASLQIGEGGYGPIYKGFLGDTEVAIRVLHPESRQGPLEFQREIDALSNLQHPNLVTLVGVCLESHALIYEYLHGGSLEDRLNCKNNSPPLHWQTRIQIAVEICSAVVFCHSKGVIHCNLKPASALLDENLKCKLTDFRICYMSLRTGENSLEEDFFITEPRGSIGYLDPEFFVSGVLSEKSDVYSIGVILLQLLTGKPAHDIDNKVRKALAPSDNVNSILDPSAGKWPSSPAIELACMALSCCEVTKVKRPALVEVLRFLKLIKALYMGLSTHQLVSDDETPTHFICPILQEIMEDPHFASDGFTYNKNAIEGWLELGRDSSPMTDMPLQDTNIVPNRALNSAIQEWLQQNREGVEPSDELGINEGDTGAASSEDVDFCNQLQEVISKTGSYTRRRQKAEIKNICQEYLAEKKRLLQLERTKSLEDTEELTKQLLDRMGHLELKRDEESKQAQILPTSSTPVLFSLFSTSELENATNNFGSSVKIGEGGYGFIYKGLLGHTEVAIKVPHTDDIQVPLELFQREMDALSNVRHPNLVALVGACLECRALIYEYLHHGSLEDRINCKDNSPPLPWQTRIRIATKLCSVVVFLHSSGPNGIIHGYLNPTTVLLDESFVCKLTDFGIWHLISTTEESVTRQIQMSTSGYMDPEFLETGKPSRKSDVFSFGVILLRLLTGKSPSSIANEVKNALDSDNLKSILDHSAGEWPFGHAQQLARLGLSCCEIKKTDRLDIIEAWRFLKLIKASCIGLSTHQRISDDEPPTYFLCPIFQEYMAKRLRELKLEKDEAFKEVEELKKQLVKRTSTSSTLKLFSPYDVKNATNNFDDSTKIGEGGYGFIYRGFLGRTEVAIKVPHTDGKQGPLEFQKEMYALSNIYHPNLVTLVGVCLESRALIYGYLHGGNLEDRLNCEANRRPLHWETRIRIATELCTVLVFLHSNKPNSIIHGDLKPGNILLDENLVCKLSDFGICHLISRTADNLTDKRTSFSTDLRGTDLYIDPEFRSTGKLSKKSDTYSFGIILLRLLTGKGPIGIAREVSKALGRDNNVSSILDPLAGEWPSDPAIELARIAVLCCKMTKRERPPLVEVLRFLKLITALTTGLSTHQRVSEDDPPTQFVCPIFQEIMQDPHFAADGFTYEKNAIEGWLQLSNRSPMTDTELKDQNIVPNRALHSSIQEWLQQNNTP